MSAAECACRTFAIGTCSGCSAPVCGDHSMVVQGSRFCSSCLAKARDDRQRDNAARIASKVEALRAASDPAERLLRAYALWDFEQYHSRRTNLSDNWWWPVEKEFCSDAFGGNALGVMEYRVLRSPDPVAKYFAGAAKERGLQPNSQVVVFREERRRLGKARRVAVTTPAWKFTKGAGLTERELSSDSRDEPSGHANALITQDGRLFCEYYGVREGGGLNESAVKEMASLLFVDYRAVP